MKDPIVRRTARRPWLAAGPLFALSLVAAFGSSPAVPLQRFEYEHLQMGTWFRLVIYAPAGAPADGAATAAFARVDALNASLSDYLPTSEVCRLTAPENLNAHVTISEDLRRILQCSRPVEQYSSGAFDLTVGPLSQLWRKARERGALPDPAEIQRARRAVGYEMLGLDLARSTASPTSPGMRLDLGAVAKGYAADSALAICRRLGLTRVLVAAAGDIVAGDPPPDQEGWRIGLPPADGNGPPEECLVASNCAVSTSGDKNQYLAYGGKRYSHIIDPRTGCAVTHGCTVTVIVSKSTSDGLMADALATAVNVLGPKDGPGLLKHFRFADARIIRPATTAKDVLATPGFKKWHLVPRLPGPPDKTRSGISPGAP